jgi:serine/threonine-protein kinase
MIMGTAAYMAPEQARARWDEVDGRTDLWSVGATMFKLLTGRVVHVADTINEQLLAAMTKPAPPLATLVPTVPIPVVEVVDKALQYVKEDRWADARAMQRAIRDAYQAITGVAPTSVRLAFDDSEAVAHADTIVLSSAKMPTSLTAAHDSSTSTKKRGSRPWGKIAWILTLCGIGVGGYSYLSQRTGAGVDAPLGEADAGSSAVTAVDFTNPFASPDPSAAAGSASVDLPGPSRVEGPGAVEPENIDPTENTPPPAESAAAPAPVKSADDVPPPAPRPPPTAAPVHPAAVTTPAPAPKPVATATHKPAPPPPRPAPPVRRPPPPPPPAPRPFPRP